LVLESHGDLAVKCEREGARRGRSIGMLDEITRWAIRERTTEQLDKALDGLMEAMSLRSAQGLGTDQALGEMLTEIVAEINAREDRWR
jgi:hypothetical protein